jgi:hypothetical protein
MRQLHFGCDCMGYVLLQQELASAAVSCADVLLSCAVLC